MQRIYRAFWTVERPEDVTVTAVKTHGTDRITAREVEIYDYTPNEARNKCLRRLAQFRINPNWFRR